MLIFVVISAATVIVFVVAIIIFLLFKLFLLFFSIFAATIINMDCNVSYGHSCLFLCLQFSRHDCIAWHTHRIDAVPHVFSRWVANSKFNQISIDRESIQIFALRDARSACLCKIIIYSFIDLIILQFAGTCAQSGMPNIDYAPINRLNLMKPMQVHICMWIYFAASIFWLISSITLLTSM